MIMEIQNKEDLTIICFNPNNEIDGLHKQLDQINHEVIFHTEFKLCITFIQSIKNQNIFLIIPSSSQFLSHAITMDDIDSIFIFSLDNDHDAFLFLENSKVIGIYNTIDLLCSSVQEQINFLEKQNYIWWGFNQDEYTTTDLSKHTSHFLWLQLFHETILHLPHDERAEKQMIDESQFLDNFGNNYKTKEALRWYMENTFLQNMIKKSITY